MRSLRTSSAGLCLLALAVICCGCDGPGQTQGPTLNLDKIRVVGMNDFALWLLIDDRGRVSTERVATYERYALTQLPWPEGITEADSEPAEATPVAALDAPVRRPDLNNIRLVGISDDTLLFDVDGEFVKGRSRSTNDLELIRRSLP